jgi:adenylate cyclase
MSLEIERKFLVRDTSVIEGVGGIEIRQGYLSIDPERSVRVRRAGELAFVTIKGMTNASGTSRSEFEYPIPPEDADAILDELAHRPLIEKTRYRVQAGGRVWEIDVFAGVNAGLVVAEVELPAEDAALLRPRLGRCRSDGRSALLQRQPRGAPLPGLGIRSAAPE